MSTFTQHARIFRFIIIGLIAALIVTGVVIFVNNTKEISVKNSTTKDSGFSPLTQQVLPPLYGQKVTPDVTIDYYYDKVTDYSNYFGERESYTDPATQQSILKLSKSLAPNEYGYGPSYYSIFRNEGSHTYEGTPIIISKSSTKKYETSQIGLKINDRSLIANLSIEVGADYMMGQEDFMTTTTQKSFLSSVADAVTDIVKPATAYACGPGMYMRPVGASELELLTPEPDDNGVFWYKLRTPIKIHDVSKEYCTDPGPMPSYCGNHAEDPEDCWNYCFYNAEVKDFSTGALRMHINYVPAGKSGYLAIQMTNVMLSETNKPTARYEAQAGKNYSDYYAAYLE